MKTRNWRGPIRNPRVLLRGIAGATAQRWQARVDAAETDDDWASVLADATTECQSITRSALGYPPSALLPAQCALMIARAELEVRAYIRCI